MKVIACMLFSILTNVYCKRPNQTLQLRLKSIASVNHPTIGVIPTPAGYIRVSLQQNSFGEWLRQARLKSDRRVYLYNGRLKPNQTAQFAVLDLTIGNKDLQQCADAVLRLKAEYLYSHQYIDSIHFKATDGTDLYYARWLRGERYRLNGDRLVPYETHKSVSDQRIQLNSFLEFVFTYCGTYSLNRETRAVVQLRDVQPGDVFVKPGSPGHAVIVVDVAVDDRGEKIFMLAQGYMPAQDIHIIENPMDDTLSPWYRVSPDRRLVTPEWIFDTDQLRRWY